MAGQWVRLSEVQKLDVLEGALICKATGPVLVNLDYIVTIRPVMIRMKDIKTQQMGNAAAGCLLMQHDGVLIHVREADPFASRIG